MLIDVMLHGTPSRWSGDLVTRRTARVSGLLGSSDEDRRSAEHGALCRARRLMAETSSGSGPAATARDLVLRRQPRRREPRS